MKTTREIGLELEQYVAGTLKPYDKSCRPSKNSGACGYKSDIYLEELPLFIECKNHKTKNISVSKSVWFKHLSEQTVTDSRKPILVTTVEGIEEPFVHMRWSDFVQLAIEEVYERYD